MPHHLDQCDKCIKRIKQREINEKKANETDK